MALTDQESVENMSLPFKSHEYSRAVTLSFNELHELLANFYKTKQCWPKKRRNVKTLVRNEDVKLTAFEFISIDSTLSMRKVFKIWVLKQLIHGFNEADNYDLFKFCSTLFEKLMQNYNQILDEISKYSWKQKFIYSIRTSSFWQR